MAPSQPAALGAHLYGTGGESGVRFAVYAGFATRVELCLFAPDQPEETARLPLHQDGQEKGLWQVAVAGLGPGQLYGYRVHGPHRPELGLLYDPKKLLVDPYARALTQPPGPVAHRRTPLSVVVDDAFDWGGDTAPSIPWEHTVIYEAHLKGLTVQHPDVPPALRGTYLGFVQPAVLEHLRSLGVTAVQLLPVQHFVSEPRLGQLGLSNYWGYNPLGLFAPHAAYASRRGRQVAEFKAMVRALHAAGFEVLLDAVFNHTAEGGLHGATLSFRGFDNRAYYRLEAGDSRLYENFSGCGNTLDVRHPRTLALVLDSLRYWVEQMHVDGFRFDLAPILGRDPDAFDPAAPFFEAVRQDPVLCPVKLIAEPWDLGPRGYQLGRFPPSWAEWNDRFRDDVRAWWRGDAGRRAALATRLAGSSDVFAHPLASVNYVTSHDGFTLRDLVSYERKHNEANAEEGRDGHGQNLSRNWGVEGPTDREDVRRLRVRLQRTFLATLAFSLGVPMLGHGDELGRTQQGNNNAYCQDNPVSWVDWSLSEEGEELLTWTRRVFALRRELPALRWPHFLEAADGLPEQGSGTCSWWDPEGRPMTPQAWQDPEGRGLAMWRHGVGDVLLLLNAGAQDHTFHLPPNASGGWTLRLDSANPTRRGRRRSARLEVAAHSLALLVG